MIPSINGRGTGVSRGLNADSLRPWKLIAITSAKTPLAIRKSKTDLPLFNLAHPIFIACSRRKNRWK
jgi:hypothetical protein